MLYVCLSAHMLYAGDHVSSCPVLMIRVRMIQNNPGMPGPAGAYGYVIQLVSAWHFVPQIVPVPTQYISA